MNWLDDAVQACSAVLGQVLRCTPTLSRSEIDGVRPAARHLRKLAHSPSVGLALYHAGHVLAFGEALSAKSELRPCCARLRDVLANAPAAKPEPQHAADCG